MIQLTRLNQVHFYLNPDLIEHIETTPDTVISLTTGAKYLVLEAAEDVVERIVAFRNRVHFASPHSRLQAVPPAEPVVVHGSIALPNRTHEDGS